MKWVLTNNCSLIDDEIILEREKIDQICNASYISCILNLLSDTYY